MFQLPGMDTTMDTPRLGLGTGLGWHYAPHWAWHCALGIALCTGLDMALCTALGMAPGM